MKTINIPQFPRNLVNMSLYMQGARQALMVVHDKCNANLDEGKGKDTKIYSEAAYNLLMTDDIMLERWLTGAKTTWRYCDYEYDKKGKFIKCKAVRI